MNKISQKLPSNKTEKGDNWTHLVRLTLADPEYDIPANVDVLLGGDVWNDIVLKKSLKLSKKGSPVAQRTRLGWILNDKINQHNNNHIDFSCFTNIAEANDESIAQQLAD